MCLTKCLTFGTEISGLSAWRSVDAPEQASLRGTAVLIRFCLAHLIAFLAVIVSDASPVSAADPPQFRDYPAKQTYHGPPKPVVLGKDDAMFRTRLLTAAKRQPNFAGNYVLETWGCGTSCVMGAAINLATGQVVRVPFSICCSRSSEPKFDAIEFRPNSRLVIFAGLRDEEEPMGAHYYEFDGREFRFLTTIPDDGSFRAKGSDGPVDNNSTTAPPTDGLISLYARLNSMCRGWSGDDPHTAEACAVRNSAFELLTKFDYCFGKQGQNESQKFWHRCVSDSIRD